MNALKPVAACVHSATRREFSEPRSRLESPVVAFLFPNTPRTRPLLATHSPSLARRLRAMPSERDDDASASASASAGPPSSDAQHDASTADAPSTAPTLQRPATPPPLAPDPPPRGRRGWMRRLVRGGDGDDDEDREDREDRDVAPAAEDGAADASAPGGEIELREVVVRDAPVEEEEEKKKPDDPSDAEEETSETSKHPSLATSLSSSARFCRICIEPVEDAQLESGDATHLGCACVSGFMHRDCAVAFVLAKRRGPPTASLRCEVCLEDMVYLDELAREMREIGRQRRRARAALVALNRAHGGSGAAPDPNRTARTGGRTANGRGRYFSAASSAATPERGGAGDDDVRFDVDDPRRDRPGWGSRNPLAWIAWIVTRPLALIFWVRYVGDRSAAAACRVFSFSPPPRRRKPRRFFFAHRR